MPPGRWDQFRLDADRFLRDWSATAISLGWTVDDVFGRNTGSPWHRIDKLGLVWLLNGDVITLMDEHAAHLVTPRGSRLTYYRSRPR
jgi:hypothetical protein